MPTKQSENVRAFHDRFGHPVRERPAVPSDDEVRFRLKLITEEYFELLAACGIRFGESSTIRCGANPSVVIRHAIENWPIEVDLPEAVDAMGDLDYVVDGTRLTFGVDGEPVHEEIQRANMSKGPNGANGKPTKPAGWKGPDIARELRRQGWSP